MDIGGEDPRVRYASLPLGSVLTERKREVVREDGLSIVRTDTAGIGHVTDFEDESSQNVAWGDVKSLSDAPPAYR